MHHENAYLLVHLIDEIADETGEWEISVNEAIRRLEADTATFYRRLYERRDAIETIAPRVFNRSNVFALAAGVCEDVSRAEEALYLSGALLSVDHRAELAQLLIDSVASDGSACRVDEAAFGAMRRLYGDRRAVATYIEHFFVPAPYIEVAVRRFVEAHHKMIRRIATLSARESLEMLFTRHILTSEHVFARAYHRLMELIGASKRHRAQSPSPELQRALSDFGLTSFPDSADDLKVIYRSLMKTYHPDVNPSGLETSQRITRAYSLLVSAYSLPRADAYA